MPLATYNVQPSAAIKQYHQTTLGIKYNYSHIIKTEKSYLATNEYQ